MSKSNEMKNPTVLYTQKLCSDCVESKEDEFFDEIYNLVGKLDEGDVVYDLGAGEEFNTSKYITENSNAEVVAIDPIADPSEESLESLVVEQKKLEELPNFTEKEGDYALPQKAIKTAVEDWDVRMICFGASGCETNSQSEPLSGEVEFENCLSYVKDIERYLEENNYEVKSVPWGFLAKKEGQPHNSGKVSSKEIDDYLEYRKDKFGEDLR